MNKHQRAEFFKNFLKERRAYKEYIEELQKQGTLASLEKKCNVDSDSSMTQVINHTLTWSNTKHPKKWEKLDVEFREAFIKALREQNEGGF